MDKELSVETKRHSMHVFIGIASIILVYYFSFGWKFFFLLLLLGGAVSFAVSRRKLPIVAKILENVDRKSAIPGKGAITFISGVFLAVFLFEKDIALASIAILTFGDSISRMGQFFGGTRLPWNLHKQAESSLIGTLVGAAAATAFVSPLEAIIAATIAMLAESFSITAEGRGIEKLSASIAIV